MASENNLNPEIHKQMVRLGILIGGGGRLPAIHERTLNPDSLAEIAVVISFKKQSKGIEWAREHGIPTHYLRWSEFKAAGKSRQDYDMELVRILREHRVALVVSAGWGLLLTGQFISCFPYTINVHPALLTDTLEPSITTSSGQVIPVFRGNDALDLALEARVPVTGCTVHYVTEEMDCGPVIMQREVPLYPDDTHDTLAARVHVADDEILSQAIEIVCAKF